MNRVLGFPSLQHLTLVKIVADSWSQHDVWTFLTAEIYEGQYGMFFPAAVVLIREEERRDTITRDLIVNLFADYRPANSRGKTWRLLEENVSAKISAFLLPKAMKKLLSDLVKPLGREIFNFYAFYLLINDSYARLIDSSKPICWTVWGTVDWKETAELYVTDKELDVRSRYKLACHNCLETEIRRLFNQIFEDRKQWYTCNSYIYEICLGYSDAIVVFWTCFLGCEGNYLSGTSRRERLSPLSKRAFNYAAYNCPRATSEYFFKHLSQPEKDQILVPKAIRMIYNYYMPHTNYFLNQVIPYFFLRLNDQQTEEVLRRCQLSHLLNCLLCWPWQSLYIKTAKRALRFMTEYAFSQALNDIVRVILAGFKDFNYAQLFRELWQLRPAAPARCRYAFPDKTLFVKMFLESEEDELFRFVRREATEIQIQELDDELDEQSVERVVEELVERVEKVVDEAG